MRVFLNLCIVALVGAYAAGIFLLTPWGHAILAKRNTSYAPGYSKRAFDLIREGDTREKVLELLGEPLERHVLDKRHTPWSGGFEEFVFSRSVNGGDYELVRVWIGPDQKVMWLQHGPTD